MQCGYGGIDACFGGGDVGSKVGRFDGQERWHARGNDRRLANRSRAESRKNRGRRPAGSRLLRQAGQESVGGGLLGKVDVMNVGGSLGAHF